jgi:DNA-binding MarR family transcriptional regulator
MPQDPLVQQFRAFNRLYTQRIGGLEASYLGTKWNLPEARVLFEIAATPEPMASQIAKRLHMDPGYLSRILRRFERYKLLRRRVSASDARIRALTLTPIGQRELTQLNQRANRQIAQLLAPAGQAQRRQISQAILTLQTFFAA